VYERARGELHGAVRSYASFKVTEREGETHRVMLWMGALILVSLVLGTFPRQSHFNPDEVN
jgi:hypothetical protein